MLRTLRTHDVLQPRQLALQNGLVEEQDRAERLVLRRGRYAPLNREMREEAFDLGLAEAAGMLALVKSDEAPGPVEVRLLGLEAVVPRTDLLSHDIE
jgi:hypothetical protein